MKISLATNFDDKLIDEIIKNNYPVYEVYGKLKHDYIGGGRPDNHLKDIEIDSFEKHVKKVRDAGIRFNYLLNGSCLGNMEQDEKWQKEFKNFLNYLKQVGVNALTISNPFILMLVKKYFPNDFYTRISTFECVDSYKKAKYWEELGADYLCVDFCSINRDFKTLKYMVDNLEHAKVELLVTNSCLKNCPMIYTHTSGLSHASNKSKNKSYEDWGLFFCQNYELKHLEEYIKSPWIRPEDIKYYEQIGIEHFKITERGFPTEWLLKRLKAYVDRKWDGNLLDLIQGHGVVENINNEKKETKTRTEIYNEIKRVRGLGQPREFDRHIFIDNSKLENFIKFFVEGKCTGNCNKCKYCESFAKKAINRDDYVSDYLLELYDKFNNVKL